MSTTPEQVKGRLPVADLHESPLNPRRTFSEQSLRELADSMGSVGLSRSHTHFASISAVGFSRPAISFRHRWSSASCTGEIACLMSP